MVTYAERPWVKRYDPGVPATINYPETALPNLLRDSARQNPNAVALVTSAHVPVAGRLAKAVTYRELDEASDALAAALVATGVKKGDRVAIVMPNMVAFVISFFGILKAGGVVAATNPTYPQEKMQFQINDCDAQVVIAMSTYYKMLKQIQPRTKVKQIIVANYKDYLPSLAKSLFVVAREKQQGHYIAALESGDVWLHDLLRDYAGRKPNVDVKSTDVAIFQYTGGTTGVSKAAASTHQAVAVNTLQARSLFLAEKSVVATEQVLLGAIPLFHVYGMVTVLCFASLLGARILLVPNARDLDDLLEIINQFKPTMFMGVPALYNAINNHAKVTSGAVSLKSIRVCMSGSAPLPPATKREFERLSGGKLLEGFGMSEAPTATHCNPMQGENRVGSVGLPFPDMDMRIVSLENDEEDVPVGELGELLMSGPQLMTGYHNKPEETAKTLRIRDGKKWLYTGDIARMDEDGYFYIVDRKKDMVLIGGFNVYPVTVDKVLADHPAVLEAAVAGVPHDTKEGQEMLKAWVVLHPGQHATAEELIEHASKYLARYEVPTRIDFIEALPKTIVGKTLRRELVQRELEARRTAEMVRI